MKRFSLASMPKAAAVTLALGIGTATAVVTIANALLLRPLPVANETQLTVLYGATPDGRVPNVPLALGEVEEFARQSRAVEGVAYFTFRGATTMSFRSGDRVIQARTSLVSGNWFTLLGASPALGRTFRTEDDARGSAPVLVLSHRAWLRHFGGDSAIIGRQVILATTGRTVEIIGVMHPGIEYPRDTDAWTPLTAFGVANGSFELASNELNVLGRLAAGTTAEQTRAELTSFYSQLAGPPFRREARGVSHGFREMVLGDVRPAMRIVVLAAATLLLIACVNVSNLLFIRAFDRARELVVRSALGASRGRIVRHQMLETSRLAAAAILGGGIVAVLAVKAFIVFAPPAMPGVDTIQLDAFALATAMVLTVFCLVVSGLTPTIIASRVNASDALRSGGRLTISRRSRLLGEALVATQVGLAVVALSAAALVTRSFINLQQTDLKFDAQQLVAAELAIPADRLASRARYQDLYRQLEMRLTSMPGLERATPVLSVPFIGSGGGIDGRVATPEQTPEARQQNPLVNMDIVTPSYFATVGLPLLRGRSFTDVDREGSVPVVVVSGSVAQTFWPGQDPIGKRVALGPREVEVVGVVPDTRYRELKVDRPSVYFPLAQSFFPVAPANILVRTSETTGIARLIRQAVSEVDPGVTVANVATIEQHLEGPQAQPRLNAIILGVFATSALSLAAIGLFSVMSTMVRRRSREIGIRMALGATSGKVRTLVVARGLVIAASGTVAGSIAARMAESLMSGLLYEINPSDIGTTVGVALAVLLAAIAASLVPANRGATVEPLVALRAES